MVMHIMVPYIGRNGDVYGSGRDQGLGILKNPMQRSVPHDMEAWKASLYTVCRDVCHYYGPRCLVSLQYRVPQLGPFFEVLSQCSG